jgi:glutathione S-transferase
MLRLYWWWTTNPQKVRLALEALGLEYELERVDLFSRAHHKPEYAELLPRKKLPALVLEDGVVLWESGAALTWLGQSTGRLWPESPAEQACALNLLFMESGVFQEVASVFFFNRVVLPALGKAGDDDRIAKAAKKLTPLLKLLDGQLEETPFLMGDFSLVDCAFAPWLPALPLDGFPRLAAWRERLQALPSWAACEFMY